MLELPHHIVDEEDSGPCREHAHWDVIKSQSACAVLADLYILSFPVYSLNLQVLGKRRNGILGLQILVVEDVLSLVSDGEVHQFC